MRSPVSAPAISPARTAVSRTRHRRTPRGLVAVSLLVLVLVLVLVSAGAAGEPPRRTHTNVERLALPRLAAVHADVQKLQARRVRIPPLPGLNDYRCILHAHAEDSTHTGGTLP